MVSPSAAALTGMAELGWIRLTNFGVTRDGGSTTLSA